MNHWFLVGRDVMWFCIAAFPLVCFFMAGNRLVSEGPEGVTLVTWAGLIVYCSLLGCLYGGIIK